MLYVNFTQNVITLKREKGVEKKDKANISNGLRSFRNHPNILMLSRLLIGDDHKPTMCPWHQIVFIIARI